MFIKKMLTVSALEKIFPDEEPREYTGEFSMLKKDQLSFQLALLLDPEIKTDRWFMVNIQIDSPLKKWLDIKQVRCVPSTLPATDIRDGNYLRTTPGLYPDLLSDVPKNLRCPTGWNGFWFQLRTDEETPAGIFPVNIAISVRKGYLNQEETMTRKISVEIIDAVLPKQKLIHTEWFYCDCLSNYYHEPVWSEKFWKIAEGQLQAASRCGVNMILTPVFTPPLDTEIGKERTTSQLVDVFRKNGRYSFGFDRLERWVRLCQDCGMEYFEISHLFTQWGAEFCPKIMAEDEGKYRRIFGWETDALSPEYQNFLAAFLPALTEKLSQLGLRKDQVYFHISDEPSEAALEHYKACCALVSQFTEGYTIMDAMSEYSFYEQGICKNPVVVEDHIGPFLEHQVPHLWIYYCCLPGYLAGNRFMAMPSARNRILGTQLYKYRIAGFLHWGFNCYNNAGGQVHLNPYAVTDADCAFPSGDAFMVYPGENNQPEESIRFRVFGDALCDLRAMELLESLTSRDFVMNILEERQTITITDYPHDPEFLLSLRSRINQEIKSRL